MTRRRLVSIVAATGLAAAGALGFYLWRANAPAQHGVLTRESARQTRETFYLKTDEGFDNTRPVKFLIPFELDRLEWRTDGNQTAIAIRFTNPVSPQKLQESGFWWRLLPNAATTPFSSGGDTISAPRLRLS